MTYYYVPEGVAVEPMTGEAIVNNWWIVHPEKGLAFYLVGRDVETIAPQCNRDRNVTEYLQPRLHTECEVRQIPLVFRPRCQRWIRENL